MESEETIVEEPTDNLTCVIADKIRYLRCEANTDARWVPLAFPGPAKTWKELQQTGPIILEKEWRNEADHWQRKAKDLEYQYQQALEKVKRMEQAHPELREKNLEQKTQINELEERVAFLTNITTRKNHNVSPLSLKYEALHFEIENLRLRVEALEEAYNHVEENKQ